MSKHSCEFCRSRKGVSQQRKTCRNPGYEDAIELMWVCRKCLKLIEAEMPVKPEIPEKPVKIKPQPETVFADRRIIPFGPNVIQHWRALRKELRESRS